MPLHTLLRLRTYMEIINPSAQSTTSMPKAQEESEGLLLEDTIATSILKLSHTIWRDLD